jgi:hypothetical protein
MYVTLCHIFVLILLITPQASIIYDEVIQLIATEPYREFTKDIVVMRLPPSDQRTLHLALLVLP